MTKGQIQPQNGQEIPFKFHGRKEKLRFVLDKSSPWTNADVSKILLASDFEVSGLNEVFAVRTGRAADRRAARRRSSKKIARRRSGSIRRRWPFP